MLPHISFSLNLFNLRITEIVINCRKYFRRMEGKEKKGNFLTQDVDEIRVCNGRIWGRN